MSDKPDWEQMEGEPDLWYGRFDLFRRMGYRRSVNAVFTKEKQGKTSTKIGPEWLGAAKQWKWEERARAYDDCVREAEDKAIAEERNKVIRSRYALMHKRIRLLERILVKLVKWSDEEEKVFLKETKTITQGEDKTVVIEKTTFNAPLLLLIDRYVGSIAAEMGERVKKKVPEEDEGDTEFTIRLTGKSPDEAEG